MSPDITVAATERATILTQLTEAHGRVLAAARDGGVDLARVREAADRTAALTPRLIPMPPDPAAHVRAAHAYVRPYLERLPDHDPTYEAVADATHRYTPRKVLRRVLDHALDHLNQIDQWLAWQRHGRAPTPTDGWATSDETLPEDRSALSPAELCAWLWRIDLAVEMVAARTDQLGADELDWAPPDGGWTLRRTLRHLACAEIYYAVWLDQPLPDDAIARYDEAHARFAQRLRQAFALAPTDQAAFFSPDDGTVITAEQVARLVLAAEHGLMGA